MLFNTNKEQRVKVTRIELQLFYSERKKEKQFQTLLTTGRQKTVRIAQSNKALEVTLKKQRSSYINEHVWVYPMDWNNEKLFGNAIVSCCRRETTESEHREIAKESLYKQKFASDRKAKFCWFFRRVFSLKRAEHLRGQDSNTIKDGKAQQGRRGIKYSRKISGLFFKIYLTVTENW